MWVTSGSYVGHIRIALWVSGSTGVTHFQPCLLCSHHYAGYAQGDGVDMTREPEVRGSLAVETVVDRIERSAIFENDFGYIRRIAWVETRDGLNRTFTFRPGYNRGTVAS